MLLNSTLTNLLKVLLTNFLSKKNLFSVLFFVFIFNLSFCVDASANKVKESSLCKNVFIDQTILHPEILRSAVRLSADNTVFHLFTHGKPGQLLIDGQWRYGKDLIVSLKTILNSNKCSHINIYGCEFGKGPIGQAAVKSLQNSLGISVSASNDITGKDGDWELEVGEKYNKFPFIAYHFNLQYNPTDDFDGDGIINLLDIDDDNDGVLDAVENPSCFYSVYEARIPRNVSSTFNWSTTTYPLTHTYDTDVTVRAQLVGPTKPVVGNTLLEFEPTTVNNVPITSVIIEVGTILTGNSTQKFQLEGWNGSSWIPISAEQSMFAGNTIFTFTNTIHPNDSYVKYRVYGSSGTGNVTNNGSIFEFYFVFNKYNRSLQPKPSCTGSDLDGDGIYNQFDLDSDGDGVSDSYEAGAINSEVPNHTFSPISDTNNDGLDDGLDPDHDGVPNYTFTYYGYIKEIVSNDDADGDSFIDLVDADDDNDGITDCAEGGSIGPGSRTEIRNINATAGTADFTNTLGNKLVSILGTTNTSNIVSLVQADTTLWLTSDFVNNSSNTKLNYIDYQLTQVVSGYVRFQTASAATSNLSPPVPVNTHDATGFTWDFDPSLFKAKLVSYTRIGSSTSNLTLNGVTINVGDEIEPWLVYHKGQADIVVVEFVSIFPIPSGTVYHIRSYYVAGTVSREEEYGIRALYVYCPFLDIDGDGLSNSVDLDADGDGCPDAVEGGANYFGSDLVPSAMDGGNSGESYNGTAGPIIHNFPNNVNSSGIPNLSNLPQTVGTSETYAATFDPSSPCYNLVLPIHLIDFCAIAMNSDTKIMWKTSYEESNSHFEIERSFDGSNFDIIGSIAGVGNARSENQYRFIDKEIGNNYQQVYYRLKQVDFNGQSDYSPIRSVTFKNLTDKLTFSPNPVKYSVWFNRPVENGFVSIYNLNGELVFNSKLNDDNLIIDNLINGTYFLKVIDSEGKTILLDPFIMSK